MPEVEGEEEVEEPFMTGCHRQIEEVSDIESIKSYQWLEKACLEDRTEALIMTAQEQALNTSASEDGVYHTRQDTRCRFCKEASKAVQHIAAGVRCGHVWHTWNTITKRWDWCTGTPVQRMDWKSQSQYG